MARRLLPAALLTPVAVGWVQWQGQERGLYDAPFGLALFTAASIVIFTFLIWRSGQELNRLDAERARAEGNMRQLARLHAANGLGSHAGAGNLDYYNQRWYEYTGMNFEMTKDWGWKPVLHPDDLENTMQVWTGALRSSQSFGRWSIVFDGHPTACIAGTSDKPAPFEIRTELSSDGSVPARMSRIISGPKPRSEF